MNYKVKEIKNIKVFSHFACPSCYIGKGIISKLKTEIDVDVEWYPTEIAKNVPKEGMLLVDFFSQKSMDVTKRYQEVKELGAKFGLVINQPTYKCNTYLALALGEYSKEYDKYESYANLVYKAHYDEDKNIGDKNVLKDILESLELNYKEALKKVENNDYKDKFNYYNELIEKYNVKTTPIFIINDEIKIVGEIEMIDFLWK